MPSPTQKSRSAAAAAALLLAACALAGADGSAGGPSSGADATLCQRGLATATACPFEVVEPPPPSAAAAAAAIDADPDAERLAHCHPWPPAGPPPEHLDAACDRARQNAILAADHAASEAAPPGDLIPDTVYLHLPEEKTWICPLDADQPPPSGSSRSSNVWRNPHGRDDPNNEPFAGGATGHPTRWILRNEASTPVVLSYVNALGLEVSARDFATFPAHADTAVYPDGPIVLPGQIAAVEGLQGQTFVVREYREVLPVHAMATEEEDDDEGALGLGHSWKSFRGVLPPTLSFLPEGTRYTTREGVVHVLGNPGRVLMKHRMGNIYVKNQYGALCPEAMGLAGPEDADDGRRGKPKDMNPRCNVLRKAFVNKVGCPVDLYFAPHTKAEGYDCEKFSMHLGSLEEFAASDVSTRNIDGHLSPLKFGNTYNGHSFVARMSHDQSLVARIDLAHDAVRDCPEPKRSGVGMEVPAAARVLLGVPMVAPVNATGYASKDWAGVQTNATASPVLSGKRRLIEKHDLLWQNHTGIMAASSPIVS